MTRISLMSAASIFDLTPLDLIELRLDEVEQISSAQ